MLAQQGFSGQLNPATPKNHMPDAVTQSKTLWLCGSFALIGVADSFRNISARAGGFKANEAILHLIHPLDEVMYVYFMIQSIQQDA